jgi:O-antigen/teichoic acid export membrane protein
MLFISFVILKKASIDYYLLALSISYFLLFCKSLRFIKIKKEDFHFSGAKLLLKEMFSYGIFIQLANLAQMLNYRMSTFLIEWFIGRKWVGIYHAGNQLSEAILAVPRSISLVQYARISNTEDQEYARKISLSLFKISGLITLLAVFVLCLIPASWFGVVFGAADFSSIKIVIYALAPGIVCLASLSILSHYFAGHGSYWVNTIGSIIGLITVVTIGAFSIPQALKISQLHALFVAACATSCAYFVNLVYTFIMFKIKTKTSLSRFFIRKEDIKIVTKEIKKHIFAK